MKKFGKLTVTICLFVFLQLCLANTAHAQADPGCDPDCNCHISPPHTPCPIDGGVVILIALAVGYGFIKYSKSRKTGIEAFQPVSS